MWECLKIVINKFLIRWYRLPLEVWHWHLLTRTIICSSKNIDRVVVVLSAVQESTVRHSCKFYKLKSFQIQYHCVFSTCTVVMTSKDDYFIATDQSTGFCLTLKGNFTWRTVQQSWLTSYYSMLSILPLPSYPPKT